MEWLTDQFPEVDSVLDVGCGIRAQALLEARLQVGVDIHRPYLEDLAPDYPGVLICAPWKQALRSFLDRSFDVLLALDFIEHLTRREGRAFLREAQRVAKGVVIFTPDGPMAQGPKDAWGMDGGQWQEHRSAWRPKDFKGWETRTEPGYHRLTATGDLLPEPIGAFWAIRKAKA